MDSTENKWVAIVNPHAGSGRTASEWKKAGKMLSRKGVCYTSRYTDCRLHAMEISFQAAEDGYRRFIAAGGDGTIHEVLGGILHSIENNRLKGIETSLSEFYLAVIPIGSGNDWIKSHGVPHDTEAVVDLISEGAFALQDVVRVCQLSLSPEKTLNCSYMVNVGGIGLDARICERVNMKKDMGRTGKLLYVNSLLYNLFRHKPSAIKVECDGETVFEGDCLSIAFGIGRYSGGGMRQTPDAVTDDGLLDFTVIPALPLLKIAKEAPRLFNGTLSKVPELTCGRGSCITVTPLSGIREIVEVDGEIVGCLPVRLEVLSQKINVLHKADFTQGLH